MSQWVRVDDWDSGIHYSGQWVDSQINTGSGDGTDETYLQDAFQGTGHYMNPIDSSPSNLSFAFNGSAVALYGMFAALNASGDPIPSWECFIDGESIAANRAFGQFPWQSYCEKDGLDDGPHTLTANIRYKNFDIHNATAAAEFWLDFIQYIPSASAITSLLPSLPYFFVDSTDPRLQYQGDWEPFGTANMTLAANASFFLDFSGQSLAWYSLSTSSVLNTNETIFPDGIDILRAPTTCQYFVDGISPVHFTASTASITSTYNHISFQTSLLPPGQHNITVQCYAVGQPFTLDYLIIQSGTSLSENASTGTSTTSPSTSGPPIPRPSGNVDIGAIVGGIVGSTLLIILLIFFVLRHRIKR